MISTEYASASRSNTESFKIPHGLGWSVGYFTGYGSTFRNNGFVESEVNGSPSSLRPYHVTVTYEMSNTLGYGMDTY